MKATTIKLDGDLLRHIEAAKAPNQSVTSYVRSVLADDLKRHRLAEASARYTTFLKEHPAEQEWLDEWDSADLARPPKARRT